MPKYLISASYSAEGLRGLQKDKASGRGQAITQLVESAGGKLECLYYALEQDDMYIVVDPPDNVAATALGEAASGSGMVHTRTIALMTVEEVD